MRLELRNIGPHKELSLELSRVNVVAGPQGSGKTTLALSLLPFFCRPRDPKKLISQGEREGEVVFLNEEFAASWKVSEKGEELTYWSAGEKVSDPREARKRMREKFNLPDEKAALFMLSPVPGPKLTGKVFGLSAEMKVLAGLLPRELEVEGERIDLEKASEERSMRKLEKLLLRARSREVREDLRGHALKSRVRQLQAALWGLQDVRKGVCPYLGRQCVQVPGEEEISGRAFELIEKLEAAKTALVEETLDRKLKETDRTAAEEIRRRIRRELRILALLELRKLIQEKIGEPGVWGDPEAIREEAERLLRSLGSSLSFKEALEVCDVPSLAALKLALAKVCGARILVLDGLEELSRAARAFLNKEVYSSGVFAVFCARSDQPPKKAVRSDIKTIFLGGEDYGAREAAAL